MLRVVLAISHAFGTSPLPFGVPPTDGRAVRAGAVRSSAPGEGAPWDDLRDPRARGALAVFP